MHDQYVCCHITSIVYEGCPIRLSSDHLVVVADNDQKIIVTLCYGSVFHKKPQISEVINAKGKNVSLGLSYIFDPFMENRIFPKGFTKLSLEKISTAFSLL